MHLRATLIATAGIVVLAVGAGLSNYYHLTPRTLAATDSPSPSPSPKVVTDPLAGMSDAQKQATIAAEQAAYDAKYAQWLSALNLSGVDLHALQREGMMADITPGPGTLAGAVEAADLIVRGHVAAITPTPQAGIITSFAVDQALKGNPPGVVKVGQTGRFEPLNDSWSGLAIVQLDAEPILLPGDQALLFLKATPMTGLGYDYEIQMVSGWYQINADGTVAASPASQFRSSIQSESVSAFIGQIEGVIAG